MNGDTLDELKARIVASMDVTDFLDFLGHDLSSIIDLFDEEIEENFARFDKSCR